MRPEADADHEEWVLTTDAGRELFIEVAAVKDPGPADFEHWRKRAGAGQVSAAVRLAYGRQRGASKFTRADRMWLERTGMEQATAEPVARHKAKRFHGRAQRVVDLCCGVGGDATALAAGADVIAVDLDMAMCRRTRWNAAVYEVADHVTVVRGRAETMAIPSGAWVHIDPDRRARGTTRAKHLSGYEPSLDHLLDLSRSIPAGAIKLGPASDFATHFDHDDLEVELVSLNGECKEATVWFGELATCRRRASKLPEGATWTDRDGPALALAVAGPVLEWVFDPDPALCRSGLIDAFAEAHGLTRFSVGVDFLTGPTRLDSPFLQAFEVIATPSNTKAAYDEITARNLGPIVIKTRGLRSRISADSLRRSPLLETGDSPATLLIAGGRLGGRAVLAKRARTQHT
jgi:hypothetical protein